MIKPIPIISWRYFLAVAMLAAICGGLGKLAFSISSILPQVIPVYPPAGISQAALFLLGLRVWPGVGLGEFFVSLSVGLPPNVAIGMGAIAILQAFTGAALLQRCQIKPNLERLRDVLTFITISALISSTITPTLGVTLLCFYHIQSWYQFGSLWWNIWLENGMGILVVMPVFLVWYRGIYHVNSYFTQIKKNHKRYIDGGIIFILLMVVSWVVFTSQTQSAIAPYPLEYLPFTLLVWIALRFAQRGTVLAISILCGIAIWGIEQGNGPFFQNTHNPTEAVLSLQIFIAIIAITALLLAATVAERQQVEQLLHSSQISLAEAQRIAHLGSWDLDLIKQQWHWSDELFRILGLSPKAIEPSLENFLSYVHPEDKYYLKQSVLDALKQQKSYSINYRIIRPNGEERIVREQAEIIFDLASIPIRITSTIQDITKQKRIEQALVQSEARLLELAHNLDQKVRDRTEELQQKNQDLAESIQTIQETQQQLIQSEKMSSLGNLVAGIAHEINNPVSFIYGNLTHTREYTKDLFEILEVYQQECSSNNAKIQECLESIDLEFIKADLPKILSSMQAGAERIRQIVLSLRNFSRLDEAYMKPVDIHQGIESTLLLLQQRLKSRQGQITVVKNYGNLPLVECYPGELNQVFMNVLINAIDAIELQTQLKMQPGVITIQTQPLASQSVLIKISDTGIGMTPETKTRIFDPFFTTKPVGKGTGLGLSISYQIIVDRHKGKLKCISEPGKGTELQIQIPLQQSR